MHLQADVISLAGPGLFESEEGADLIAGRPGSGMDDSMLGRKSSIAPHLFKNLII